MKRSFILATMLWLAACAAAQAQTNPQTTPQGAAETGPVFPSASVTTGLAPATSTATQAVSPGTVVSDPLSVPASSILPSGTLATVTTTESSGNTNNVTTVNPQKAVQLPGEAANTTTQTPNTTASAAAPAAAPAASASVGTSSSQLCSSSVPSSTGEMTAGSLVGIVSANGC